MRKNLVALLFLILAICMAGYATTVPHRNWQDDPTRNRNRQRPTALNNRNNRQPRSANTDIKQQNDSLPPKQQPVAQPLFGEDEEIPDSLLNTRWKVQRTTPITFDDLDQNAMDLKRPDNLPYGVEYNDTLDMYVVGIKIGGGYVNAPIMMTPAEYRKWSEKRLMDNFFRKKNDEIYQTQGKEKFDFTDMHFDLGPAEKIFGPGGVRIKTQGSAELKFGATLKNIDNPSLPVRNRKTTTIDFDEKINLNMTGKVGDKVNLNLNYNTESTFDFDSQNMKLKYDGKEDEIVKLLEAGYVSFPSNSTLIRGASSLFGLRTDLQFGKLKLQMVASQKKSNNKSVSTKGGAQFTPFEIDVANYEDNRHFFLSQYFRDKYDAGMRTLPNLMTGVKINRVEVWITNKTGVSSNTRNIIALTDLGESEKISNTSLWSGGGSLVPSNAANTEYSTLVGPLVAARDSDQASTVLEGAGLVGGVDYEKLEHARLLSSSEYTVNSALGYISLNMSLQTDQVLAVAFEYTYGGVTYQVGEFSSDITDVKQSLYVKALKNTSNNPSQGNWDLMMKNVYMLASNVEKDKFRLDIKFQSDTAGVYLSYIPEPQVKDQILIRLMGADRLDNNNKPHPNGYFDYVDGYTVSRGRVFLPSVEPFGATIRNALVAAGVQEETAEKYVFSELYTSTKTVAKQIAEKNKYQLVGQFRGSSDDRISLGQANIPEGSVVVTAGGVPLTEGSDYTVNYDAGEVTIINRSILEAGTNINVSLESNTDYGQTRKTMLGFNWEYNFTKNFQLSGTLQHLSEQALTTKVTMGSEPLNNTMWGVNVNWKKESQWLTNMLDKIPFLHLTQPSNISFTGEFAQLIAGQSHGTQDNASYIDDFENTESSIDVSTPTSWILSSVPSMFNESTDKTTLKSGYNRSLLAWYTIDPLFTRRSSSLTPGHIKSDLNQLSNHYLREVYVRELYPNREQSSYNGASSTISTLSLAYYPQERGPYNFNPDLNAEGKFDNPESHWGGMMRKLDTSDFETANIEYIEFWMMDPFIYTREEGTASEHSGDFYINLGEVSEDILRDGKKFYESGLPVDGTSSITYTQWGKIPTQTTQTYSFATSSGARARQDLGYNGLNDEEERAFETYQEFLQSIQGKVSAAAFDSIMNDPAADNYHYFRGSDYDDMRADIFRRYKYINNPQGNSPDTDNRNENYDTSYKTMPDVEDINQDYTLNEYEKYYQYHVSIRPEDFEVGKNFIVDKRVIEPKLRNGTSELEPWYQFRIPLREAERRFGSINDFTSIRFMRMFLTGFKNPIVLRFANLDLVRGEWRMYEQNLDTKPATGTMTVSSVNLEENQDKTPVNYVMPPGIRRDSDPNQPQIVENNEQALDFEVSELGAGSSKAVYKNTSLDLRQYKRIQMFVHANAPEMNTTSLENGDLAVFIRMGSDYKNNYYEYEIPLQLTAPGVYDRFLQSDCRRVWPQENMLDVPLSVFTAVKKERNIAKTEGRASYNREFSTYDEDNPANRISIMGNPSLGEVKTMMIGIRNKAATAKTGEVWVNELRLKEYNNKGGWAAQGNLNMQLSDFGTINVQGRYLSEGFGGLEEGVAQRLNEDQKNYSVTTSLELGKFFPDKIKVSAPLYYSITKEENSPRYNPLDTDLELDEALEGLEKHERDSVKSIVVTKTTNTNFSLYNVRVGVKTKRHPMPYDPANFAVSYSHSHRFTSGETTVYEKEDNWRGSLDYSWVPVYTALEPFKKIKSKSKWFDILKRFGLNWLPQSVNFNTDILRNYYELQERDMEDLGGSQLPLTFSEQFLWNREFAIKWDLTKNIHMNFRSATHAEIEEPYTPINKDLYADRYEAWKDSVRTSIRNLGRPLDYTQTFTASYQLPLNLIPIFDWINGDASYNATYNWIRGSNLEDGTSLGNAINNTRQLSLNGTFNLEKLYNHVPFLKATNTRFNKDSRPTTQRASKTAAQKAKTGKNDTKAKDDNALGKELPKNSKSFEKEITLMPDTFITVNHGKKSKRLIVTAKDESGKSFRLKYKTTNDNTLRITNKVDSALKLKITVTPKEPLENKGWYKATQLAARLLMSVRNIGFSYRNNYSISLPGFMPMVGDAFGQKRDQGIMSPGLDFAFGLTGDDYIERARENGWLLVSESVATPANTNKTEDLQLRATIEPIKNLKIDLTASRQQTTAKSVQYMYAGNPTTQSGSLTMTTISLRSAFESLGDATNGYHSPTFSRFCNSLDAYRQQVENKYIGSTYPQGTSRAGEQFSPENGQVNRYSADVMVPAFLNAYTNMGKSGLAIFPAISKMLPNWTINYSGLGKLPWFRDIFKSVTLRHAYRSTYAVGSYSTYSTYMEYMNGLGFITDATSGAPIPNSMYNVSAVSLNEQFSPLLGVDLTFNNGLTTKLEYKSTRLVTLSMTSIQINENTSKDWVIGASYKINDFNLFGSKNHRKVKNKKTTSADQNQRQNETAQNNRKSSVNRDLNLRLDLSFRRQAMLTRDIATVTSVASSGNTTFKISFLADYTLSRLLTMSFYFDRQTNTPLLASNSYPTTTNDFGFRLKFSLTR